MSGGFSESPDIQDLDPSHSPEQAHILQHFTAACALKYFNTDIFFLIIVLLCSIIFLLKWWTSVLIDIIPT